MNIGAGLTRSDIVSVIEAEKQVIGAAIAKDGAVNTELFNVFPGISGISGIFDIPDETFDQTKRKIGINLHPGVVPRSAVSQVKPGRVSVVLTGTVSISEFVAPCA
jgi:hypothetical protein